MTDLVPAEPQGLDLALLKAVGLDRAAPEQRQLAIAIAERYGLDLMLKHLVLIEGRPYVTRDALIHIAHRSGQFDGIEVTQPVLDDRYWRCVATVWRKDMSHPFSYGGRYPASGGNAKFAEEMAVKVAESMALRRAFDVAAPVVEERWDTDVPVEAPPPRPTLADLAAQKAANLKAVELLAEPMTVEASAEAEVIPAGLSVDELKDRCVKAGKSSAAISKVIGCAVDEVGARVKHMTDTERGVLADELGIEWRS
jgi:hypothetical protein